MAGLAAAAIVLDFWFAETPASLRFATDPGFDGRCAARFGTLHRLLSDRVPDAWATDAQATLAAIIVLDQFSRNIDRGSGAAFANDAAARALTEAALVRGDDAGLDITHRQFLYMPLMHAEDAAAQAQSLALFSALGDPDITTFAERHAAAIDRFGRFPARNAALGRMTTAAEAAFLADGNAGF